MRPRHTHSNRTEAGTSGIGGTGDGPTSLGMAEGDDLLRARRFCRSAAAEMEAIIAADRSPIPTSAPARSHTSAAGSSRAFANARGRDPVWLCERLSIIQRGAKRARARAVYRSAQNVLGLIQRRNAHMPIDWTRVDGRLFVLNKLLGQYETGLGEVEAVLLPSEPSNDASLNAVGDFDPVQTIAADTLRELLPHASETEQAALNRLMDFDPDYHPEGEASEPQPAEEGDTLQTVLPDLVQRLLEVGRQYGKIVSVSHALDDVRIPEGMAALVAASLFDRLSDLIASDLPLQGVGRLDMGIGKAGLRISGSGFESFDLPLDVPVNIHADAPAWSVPPVEPAPRITDDTEGVLRSQLAAMMHQGGDFE